MIEIRYAEICFIFLSLAVVNGVSAQQIQYFAKRATVRVSEIRNDWQPALQAVNARAGF
ncbi:MAG: hypothetical protein R2794_07810 [Chitinophagales bacterium]